MASVRAVSCLLFATAIYATAGSFVNLECPKSENHGVYGQQSMLQCVVKVSKDVEDGKCTILRVTWKKEENTLLKFEKNITQHQGFKFAEPTWNGTNMNVSLLLTNTKLTDNGKYECMVMTDRGYDKVLTSLQVTATYEKPAISTLPEKPKVKTDVSIYCNTTGGHPKGRIDWFDENNKNSTDSSKLVVKKREDGLFSLSSKYTVLQGADVIKCRCVVYNANEVQEGEATFKLEFIGNTAENVAGPGTEKHNRILAPAVVIGSLIVGLLLAIVIFKRRSNRNRRPSAAPLMMRESHDIEDRVPENEDMVEKDTLSRTQNQF